VADGAGHVIVTDRDNHMIRLVTAEGAVTTLGGMPNLMSAAEGFGTTARFAQPSGVAADRSGILYVADACNNRIVAGLPSDGTRVFATWPTLAVKAPPLDDVPSPRDVPYAWEVFVGQPNSSGAVDGKGSEARLTRPQGLALDDRGALFVVDGGHALRRVSPSGDVATLSGTRDRMKAPIGVAVDGGGTCYVTDGAHVLWRISVSGEVSAFAGSANRQGEADGTGGAASFNFIPGVAVDPAGNVYVADHNNFTVRKVTPDGRVTTFAGLAGSRGCFDGVGSAARFSLPTALATDRSGNVYVADDNRIRKITPHGAVQTVNHYGALLGRLDGIAVDRGGTVYVADRDHHAIWRVAPRGAVSKLAGSGMVMGGEGWVVTGLAVDRFGNVYVSDAVRNCIVKGVRRE